jgi:hypothetical protein
MLLHGAFRFPEIVGENYFEAVLDGVDADEQRGVFSFGFAGVFQVHNLPYLNITVVFLIE